MSPSNPSPEAGIHYDPLAPLAQAVHWLAGATVALALGLAIAAVAARAMRSRHLHWSWAATGLALIVLARSALGSAAGTLAVAALGATIRSRRWHREDLEAGADLAEVAAGRRHPLDALRAIVRRIRGLPIRWRRLPKGWQPSGWISPRAGATDAGAASWFRGERLIVGCDESGRFVSIRLGGAAGGTHALVAGATGSGKTFTLTWIATRTIARGMAAIVIAPKHDRHMRDHLRAAAAAARRPFIEWTPHGPSVYNPYARGGETQIADKVLAGERFTEPHYLRQAQRYLGHEMRVLRAAEIEVSLRVLVRYLDPEQLELLTRSLPESERRETAHAYLDSLTARQRSDLAGVRDRLAIMAESDVGRWLDPQTPGAQRFDLLAAVQARAVVYFSLESDDRPLLGQMLGAAIVQDLQTTAAALQHRPLPTLVVIDEFSALAAEHVGRLFGRARSAGFSLLLGTQELSDLHLPGWDALRDQILGNLSTLIAHRQVVPESAELIASIAGTKGVWRSSRHSDGRRTIVRAREPIVHADAIKALARGWTVVIELEGGEVHVTRIFSAEADR
jgi:hypothetical protein